MKKNVFFVSLGCDKNLVDSEVMLGLLSESGWTITDDEIIADAIIVNTCGFINDAKEESIETILEMAQYKEKGNCKGLIVTGCLSERYKDELMKELPEVDGILGTSNYKEIVKLINEIFEKKNIILDSDIASVKSNSIKRMVSPTNYYAYLKIAEGCNNHCTYCIIPKLRGSLRSRTIESLIDEAKYLVKQGKKEIILVAQDVTKYGIDIYKDKKLPTLLKKLCEIENLEWIRLLYCYPEDITDELIEVMKEEEKILPYIDIPIQHVNDIILKNMARKSNKKTITNVIKKLRKEIPNVCIRTTLIVGFPGETDEQFKELKEFVKEYELDRLGVFTYSKEEGTKAASMTNQIDEDIKVSRRDEIMILQQQISKNKNLSRIGENLDVLIEGYIPEDEVYLGRTYLDAPNVDGIIFVKSKYELLSGQIVKVEVTGASEYDLIGVIKE